MVAGLGDIGVAVADVEVGNVNPDADELGLVVFSEEEEEMVAVAEEADAMVEEVTTAHILFWQV